MACDGSLVTSGIRYTWSVYSNGEQHLEYVSRSKDASKFLLPSYTLETQTLYEVKLSVSQAGSTKSSTTSCQIYIASSNIVAVVSGGLMRTMHPSDTLVVDGSGSYDEDIQRFTGFNAGLTFEWSCYQIAPDFLPTCGVTVVGDAYTAASITLFASELSVDTTSQIVLTIYDSGKSRSAQARVVVVVADDSTPQVTLVSNAPSLMNPSRSLLLTAAVQLPMKKIGSANWTVDDTSLNLISIAALPLTVTVPNSMSISQLITANSLPPGSSLTFTFTLTLTNGKSSSASIIVKTNAPPQPGLFTVSPTQGTELKTNFQFAALLWQDSSLPLTYQFGMIASTGSSLSLQSRSESPFATANLPAGQQKLNYSQSLFLQVYDSLNSSTLSYITSVVFPMAETNSTYLRTTLLDKLSTGNSSVNGMKSSTALVSSILNSANCTAAPNCTSLNRFDCTSLPNTCGNCISSQYVGDANSNTPCILLRDLISTNSRKLSDMPCLISSDCLYFSPYVECSEKVCAIPQKKCADDCSGQGQCVFLLSTDGSMLDSCSIIESNCTATCICNNDWSGRACSLTSEDMINRNDLRHQVVSSLTSLVSLEDPTEESISSWSQSLSAASLSYDELHSDTLTSVQSIVDNIISNALSIGTSPDKADGVLGSIDSLFNNVIMTAHVASARRSLASQSNQSSSTISPQTLTLISSSQASLQQYSSLVSNNLLVGQQPVATIQDQYRLITSAFPADSASVSLVSPLSEAEKSQGKSSPSLRILFNSSTASTKLSTVLLNSNIYGNTDFNSNPLQLNLNSDMSQCAEIGSCFIELVLQNNAAVNTSANSGPDVERSYQCTTANILPVKISCPNDIEVPIYCNATNKIVTVKCPTVTQDSVCNAVMGSEASNVGCKTLNFTSTTTTCLCPLSQNQVAGLSSSTARRKLKKVKVVESSNSTYMPLSGSISFVAMLGSVVSNFEATAMSAQNLNGSTISKSWQVLVTIGVLALAVIFCGLGAHWSDQVDSKTKVLPETVSKLSEGIFTKMFASTHKQGLQKFKRAMQQLQQKTPEMKIIEASLPSVLRSKPYVDRFVEEVRHFHRWLGIAFHFSPVFPRLLRVLSLTTSVMSMLFIQALTYNINNPDDGSCELQTTRSTCLEQTSDLQNGAAKCYWTYDNGAGACHFNQPATNIQVVLFVAIFAATVSTPIAVSADWVICNILVSKTRDAKASTAIVPTNEAVFEVADEISPDKQKSVLKKSFEDDVETMFLQMNQFKESLPIEKEKEFCGLFLF